LFSLANEVGDSLYKGLSPALAGLAIDDVRFPGAYAPGFMLPPAGSILFHDVNRF
jgi:hypothetical protein